MSRKTEKNGHRWETVVKVLYSECYDDNSLTSKTVQACQLTEYFYKSCLRHGVSA